MYFFLLQICNIQYECNELSPIKFLIGKIQGRCWPRPWVTARWRSKNIATTSTLCTGASRIGAVIYFGNLLSNQDPLQVLLNSDLSRKPKVKFKTPRLNVKRTKTRPVNSINSINKFVLRFFKYHVSTFFHSGIL